MDNPTTEQCGYTELARKIYARLPNNRDYALSKDASIALGAFAKAWYDQSGNNFCANDEDDFAEALQELGKHVHLLSPCDAATLPAKPIQIPFGPNANMTVPGQIWKKPKLREIAARAHEIAKQWTDHARRKLD